MRNRFFSKINWSLKGEVIVDRGSGSSEREMGMGTPGRGGERGERGQRLRQGVERAENGKSPCNVTSYVLPATFSFLFSPYPSQKPPFLQLHPFSPLGNEKGENNPPPLYFYRERGGSGEEERESFVPFALFPPSPPPYCFYVGGEGVDVFKLPEGEEKESRGACFQK